MSTGNANGSSKFGVKSLTFLLLTCAQIYRKKTLELTRMVDAKRNPEVSALQFDDSPFHWNASI